MQIVWDRLDAAAWSAALPAGAPLQQHWRYGAAAAALGRRVHRAEIFLGGRRIGLAQCLTRGTAMALISRGPAWCGLPARPDRRRALRALARSVPGRGVLALLATPDEAGAPPAALPLLTGPSVAEIGLDIDARAMRGRMGAKWRNHLNAALRAAPPVRSTAPPPSALRWLTGLDRAQQRVRGYRALPPAFVQAWAAAGTGTGLRLLTAGPATAPVAAMLFLLHPGGAAYHVGWSGPEGRRLSAHHLLLWRAMQDFARDGRSAIDLGSVDTERAPGLARFKIGAGGRVRALGQTGLTIGWRR